MVSHNQSLLWELYAFLKIRKAWWLAPIIVMLIIIGIFFILGQSATLSPFIYAFF